ncbi:C2 calcium-dependent domain-containing protein 4B-like protein [Willisornis vidua]|uniref:C2 calcium-dependent domain-containing protein 4B-like protein n=1 Tax=Willisornis vidua TaxID=1566151 RepID=A0ABQ9DJD9_9PASS|nr:C2 calcium-dependent domain-containing protein 4B-like protein [Willisornis vidua]
MSLWQGKGSGGIFCHVVTPESIPRFTIPSLDAHGAHRGAGKGMGQLEGTAWRGDLEVPAVRDERGVPGSALSARAMPDPTAWAALSLPHLPRVTTPYGFVTLGQSPQVTSEEAFFHSGSGHSRGRAAETGPSWQEEPGCCGHPEGHSQTDERPRDDDQPSPCATNHKDGRGSPASRTVPRRCASPLGTIQRTDVLESKEAKSEKRLLGAGCQRGSSSLELPAATGRKNLFQRILRRHLVHPRQLKPVDFTLH